VKAPTLIVDDLCVVGMPTGAALVDGVSLEVAPGEILGLVGESGSGKTTLGLALLAHCKPGSRLSGGRVLIGGQDILGMRAGAVRRLRGRMVAYIPQSPASALNPALRIGTQLRECLAGGGSGAEDRVMEVLGEVALADSGILRRYPHQLSGGQQQRVAIAMAFMCKPGLIVLDEPTTGLDVSTQTHVLETVRRMCHSYGTSAVYISHDMAAVAGLADRIAVMYSARIVEIGPTSEILAGPLHPYTNRLLLAVPDLDGRRSMVGIPGFAPSPSRRPLGCAFAPRCAHADDRCRAEAPPPEPVSAGHLVRCHKSGSVAPLQPPRGRPPKEARRTRQVPVIEVRGLRAWYGRREVLSDVTLSVPAGHCVALLGESGSGKTTLSRGIAGLHHEVGGEVLLEGEPLPRRSLHRTVEQRRRVQYVFQNPYESLNPRKTVRELILQSVRVLTGRVDDAERVVADALERGALRPDLAGRYPDQLSGGERQRVAIARALATGPQVLICDEITSALDVSIQSSIVELLTSLQRDLGLSLLFVTHNIALVRNVAQSVAVLQNGRIVEHGDIEEIFDDPRHPYTRSLIANTPRFPVTFLPEGTVPS
jgi:peptide/nickel transport system ATP-binding protein